MKKAFLSILAVFTLGMAQAQITVTLGSALLQNPGTDVHLPVSVKGLDGAAGGKGVTAIEFHIGYSGSNLTYDTTLNFNAATPSNQWFFGGNGLEYSSNWLEPTGNKLNIPDNTVLFEIVFHYAGGISQLSFDTARCLLVDSAFNIIPGVQYVNGQVTPGQGSGESRWNGTGSWNTSANWSNGIPGDSTNAIIETGTVTVDSYTVSKSLTINPATVADILPGFAMTVNRNFDNNGSLNLKSDVSGTGSLIVQGAVSGSGTNTFERYLDQADGSSHFVSSPVAGSKAGVFGSNATDRYVESSSSWLALDASDNLETGYGYRVSVTGATTATFQGLFATSNIAVSNLSNTASVQAATRGLNLVGNPYPSAIAWDQGNWIRTNVDQSVYVWNGYKYITWNGSIGALKDGIIPAMQGFFIKSNATGGSITIPAGSRMHSSRPYYKSVEAVSDWLSMKIESMTDTSHFDEAFVHVLGGSTPGFDSSQDAWKLAGSLDYPQIYTMAPDQSILSINTQPEYTSVPIAVQTPVAGSYKITFGGIGSFNGSQPLFFEDKASQSVINLRNNGSYVFASSGGLETGNFILHFEETGIREHAGNGFLAWSSGSVIHVDARAQGLNIEQLEIYNLTGRIVCTINNPLLPVVIPQTNMPTGLYLIKVKTREGVYTQKLLVK